LGIPIQDQFFFVVGLELRRETFEAPNSGGGVADGWLPHTA
jgi:hypothetical protein